MAVDLRQRNVSVSANTRVSIKLQDSNVMRDVNVNWDAISKIDIISENYFRCKFDHALNPSTIKMEQGESTETAENCMATLTYEKAGKTTTFMIFDNLVDISGGAEGAQNSSNIFRIESSGLSEPHVQIKYIPESKKYQIAAYGKTRVSGRQLEISQQGMPKWYLLANNSKILMNDLINVRFEVK
jgi:hypothetical protein